MFVVRFESLSDLHAVLIEVRSYCTSKHERRKA
ncbi:hypothetical protein M2232_004313 [Bradyrhizobium japonicum]|nr:hypothetical protein [Bradyrhizobium japonicum]MCS3962295.1 hypothetical protein [Bradyrhizobium japonicum]MCS3994612.1 hypothetical protein [Bradyrhizobium japonicum]MCW2220781.1 hypothetical protein [Bradyrhizobium japonicum]MCW2345395.1 hypothetical protein [Bradyrhizobium japonicum]